MRKTYNILSKFSRLSKFNFVNIIDYKSISKVKSPRFFDLRGEDSYKKGHISGAVNTPTFFTYLAETKPEKQTEMIKYFENLLQDKGITGNENLVFYEDYLGSLKGVSCRAYYLMTLFGYDKDKLFILKDGYESAKLNKNSIEVGDECKVKSRGDFKIKFNPKAYITYQELLTKVLGKSNIIDVRDLEEWKGLSSSPYGPDFTPRKGRIPGAKHLLWTDLMTNDSKDFVSDDKIIEKVAACGVKNKSDEIIVYCFKGCRSSNTLVALEKAGYTNVRNYLGSWNEWSRIMDLPVDDKKL